MLPTHDKKALLTNNQYVSYAPLSWAGNMYLMGFCSKYLKYPKLKVQGPIFQNWVLCFIWRIITLKEMLI